LKTHEMAQKKEKKKLCNKMDKIMVISSTPFSYCYDLYVQVEIILDPQNSGTMLNDTLCI